MQLDRRQLLGALAALSACSRAPAAGRGDVFAAGQPAALLILALAPQRLLGWPRRPPGAALALLPAAADLPEVGALAGGGAPPDLEGVAASRPALVLDYGDVDPAHREIAARIRDRLDLPYRLIDGALRNTPAALREAGALLGAQERGARLAEASEAILARWSAAPRGGPSFYYARGPDGLETGFRGALATEVLEGAGWTNVAPPGRDLARVSREQVAAWNPELIVTLDPDFARGAATAAFWRERPGGGRRRLLLLPELPFGWIDRPPSLNRLLGCQWVVGNGDPAETAVAFLRLFFGSTPDRRQLAGLVPRWIA